MQGAQRSQDNPEKDRIRGRSTVVMKTLQYGHKNEQIKRENVIESETD